MGTGLPSLLLSYAIDNVKTTFGRHLAACSVVASSTWLFWDVMLTMEDEVEVVWPMPWSFIKCLYFLLRYLAVIAQVTNIFQTIAAERGNQTWSASGCMAWQTWQVLHAFILTLSLEYVLVIRVMVLYAGIAFISYGARVFYFVKLVVVSATIVYFLQSVQYDSSCLLPSTPASMLIYAGSTLIFHVVVFVLILVKFSISLRAGWSNTPIMVLLMRDGTWSFFFMFSLMLGYGCFLTFSKSVPVFFYASWLISSFGFVGYRNLLNMFHLKRQQSTTRVLRITSAPTYRFSTDAHNIYDRWSEDAELPVTPTSASGLTAC